MKTKVCYKCGQALSIQLFSKNRAKKDGLNNQCKTCQKHYKDTHYKKNKQSYIEKNKRRRHAINDYVQQIKIKHDCSVCGESHPACLEFHHNNPNKKISEIANLNRLGWSINRINKEMGKCTILCANCHRKLHWDTECPA